LAVAAIDERRESGKEIVLNKAAVYTEAARLVSFESLTWKSTMSAALVVDPDKQTDNTRKAVSKKLPREEVCIFIMADVRWVVAV